MSKVPGVVVLFQHAAARRRLRIRSPRSGRIPSFNTQPPVGGWDAVTGAITKTLKKGDTVALIGFGTFSVSKRKAREGRNPQTGEAIKIAACKVARFSPGKGLKDALN